MRLENVCFVAYANKRMATTSQSSGTIAGVAGGTLLSIAANLETGDVVKTAVLACVGAVVSFVVSLLMKWVTKKLRRGAPS